MATCKLIVSVDGREFVWRKVAKSTAEEARKWAEAKFRYWKSRISSLFGKNAHLRLEENYNSEILRIHKTDRKIPGLPPRLAGKKLFLTILRSIYKNDLRSIYKNEKGSTVRKSNILDRLYGPYDRNLQLRSLRSDCRFYGIEFHEVKTRKGRENETAPHPEPKICFSARDNRDIFHSIQQFLMNYPRLMKAA